MVYVLVEEFSFPQVHRYPVSIGTSPVSLDIQVHDPIPIGCHGRLYTIPHTRRALVHAIGLFVCPFPELFRVIHELF